MLVPAMTSGLNASRINRDVEKELYLLYVFFAELFRGVLLYPTPPG
jgi:hypothetical protein